MSELRRAEVRGQVVLIGDAGWTEGVFPIMPENYPCWHVFTAAMEYRGHVVIDGAFWAAARQDGGVVPGFATLEMAAYYQVNFGDMVPDQQFL